MISIVLAESHEAVRQEIHRLLEMEKDMEIIGEVDIGPDAVNLVERLEPCATVIGLLMSYSDSLAIARQISESYPLTKIVLISAYPDEAYVSEAIGVGVHGYVDLDRVVTDLAPTIRIITQGANPMDLCLSG